MPKWLLDSFCFVGRNNTQRGIYRHLNGNENHFAQELEMTYRKLDTDNFYQLQRLYRYWLHSLGLVQWHDTYIASVVVTNINKLQERNYPNHSGDKIDARLFSGYKLRVYMLELTRYVFTSFGLHGEYSRYEYHKSNINRTPHPLRGSATILQKCFFLLPAWQQYKPRLLWYWPTGFLCIFWVITFITALQLLLLLHGVKIKWMCYYTH